MNSLKQISNDQYNVDFEISKGYVSFSSELLRLSLLAMGGFGALVLGKLKAGDSPAEFLRHPLWFLVSMALFALCSAATLFHRYYASDCMSWYIAWLRADADGRNEDAKEERVGFHKQMKRSAIALIISEVLFGAAVLFFMIAMLILLL